MGNQTGRQLTSYPPRRYKKTARAGLENTERLAVLKALNLPVSLIDPQYTYRWANGCYCAAHGKIPEDIIGRTVPSVWGDETFHKDIKGKLDRCFEGVEVRDKVWMRFPALGRRYCEVIYSPYRLDDERVVCAIVLTYDITERKEMEGQLKERRKHLERPVEERTKELSKFRSIFENAAEGIFQITPDGHFLTINPAFARIHGYDSPEDFITAGIDIEQLHVEPDRRREYVALLHEEGHIRNFEFKVYCRDGTVAWVSVNARAVRDETGAVLYHEGTIQDISQRKQAEECILIQRDLSLKLAGISSLEDALLLYLDTGMKLSHMESGGIYVRNRQTGNLELACSAGLSKDFERKIALVNGHCAVYPSLMAGEPTYRSPHGEAVVPFRTEVLAEGYVSTAAIPVRHNGETIACINLASRTLGSVPLHTRAALELIATQLGIVFARIQAGQDSPEREEQFSLMFRSSPGATLLTTMDGRCVSVNQGFLDIVEHTREEVLGKTTSEFESWLSKEWREKVAEQIREPGSAHNHETRIRTKSGALKDIILASIELIAQGGERYVLTMFHDVTERKRAEAELLVQKNLALDLAATSSLEKALSLCLETALQTSGTDCGSIHLRNRDTSDFEILVHKGLSEQLAHRLSHVKVHSEIWLRATQHRKVAFFLAENATEAVKPYILKEGIRSTIMVPVLYKGRVIACIHLGSHGIDPGHPGLPTLHLIASQVGNILARMQAQQQLEREIETRKQAEEALEAERCNLQEANVALKVLLKRREEDRKELEERLVSNVKQLVLPQVEKLKKKKLEPSLHTTVDFIEESLKEILTPLMSNLRSFNFTPRQLEIITLIKEGRTTKDIAEFLYVSKDTIDKQRFLIRKKLDINKDKANLRSFLLSLA